MIKKRMLLILTLCLTLFVNIPVLANSPLADKVSINNNTRMRILQEVVYYTTNEHLAGAVNYTDEIAQKYLKMSDAEFNEVLKQNIQDILDKQDKGEKIWWDMNFLKDVKNIDPDLGNKVEQRIQKQLENAEIEKIENTSNAISANISAGSETQSFQAFGTDALNINLFALVCNCTWKWDGSGNLWQISPVTYGKVFAPLWQWDKVVSDSSQWCHQPTDYYLQKTGHFLYSFNGNVIGHRYPWLDVHLVAGGYYAFNVSNPKS